MEPSDFAGAILRGEQSMVEAISTGAQWEVWLQVELLRVWMKGGNGAGAREVQYPAPLTRYHADLVLSDHDSLYVIELKVEGGGNRRGGGAGNATAFFQAMNNDVIKLQSFQSGPVGMGDRKLVKWAVGIAYSTQVKEAATTWQSQKVLYQSGSTIGVVVVSV